MFIKEKIRTIEDCMIMLVKLALNCGSKDGGSWTAYVKP